MRIVITLSVNAMSDDKRLNVDEILCLQLMGYKPHEILRADLDYFDQILYNERSEEMDRLLDKADVILTRQEKAGVKTLIHYDTLFPKPFKAIGDDCPPLIHLLGNLDLLNRDNYTAIIGARNCDKRGFDVAYKLGVEYAKRLSAVSLWVAMQRRIRDVWQREVRLSRLSEADSTLSILKKTNLCKSGFFKMEVCLFRSNLLG